MAESKIIITKDLMDKVIEELTEYRAIGTVEELKALKDYKELYDVYKLIGTIEEFRNLKYKNNVLPIASIEFSKEDMQKIVDEKVAQIELDIQEIRNQAIDEFFEQLQKYEDDDMWLRLKMSSIYEIAERMKGE